jgi:hypothetical protein
VQLIEAGEANDKRVGRCMKMYKVCREKECVQGVQRDR